MDSNPLIELGYRAFKPTLTWVLFSHGTCIVFIGPEPNATELALQDLKEHGEVRAGGPAGDFSISELDGDAGWLVFYDFDRMITLVLPDEVDDGANEFEVGYLGRLKRQQDFEKPVVIHVQHAEEE